MKIRLLKIYDSLTDAFWLLPALMALAAGAAALISIAVDNALGAAWARDIAWIWSGGADGARSVLSVISGSVITVVSIVFTITVTALAQTSSHFGPRVLRTFTSDRGNQFVLGTYVATFVFCLLVLRSVRSLEEALFVPYISVNIGIGLSLASLAVLIYFIHHVTQHLQADNLIADAGSDLLNAIEHLYPEQLGQAGVKNDSDAEKLVKVLEHGDWESAEVIESTDRGYIQRIDAERLMQLASQHDLLIRLENRPGDFVMRSAPLMRVKSSSPLRSDLKKRLAGCFSIGRQRTPHQDATYSMQQLVEVALRALSPGINEPFTAITCIDWLGASIRELSSRIIPSDIRNDDAGQPRILAHQMNFQALAHTAFNQISLYGSSNPLVACHLLNVIGSLAPDLRRMNDLRTLTHQVWVIGRSASTISNPQDHQQVESCMHDAIRALALRRCNVTHDEHIRMPARSV